MESVKREMDVLGHGGSYRPPARLRKRTEFSSKGAGDEGKVFEANEYVWHLCVCVGRGLIEAWPGFTVGD